MHTSELLETIYGMCPTFRDYFDREAHLFRDEQGRVTVHGVFIVLANFVLDSVKAGETEGFAALLGFVEDYVDSYELGNAICTCFLEAVKGTPAHVRLVDAFGPKSAAFMKATPFG